jgi:hypothetical protein
MLFKRNKKPTALQPIQDQPANFNTALEYMTGLSSTEFAKLVKVAEVYRETDAVAAGLLGRENQPTTFIDEPATVKLEDVKIDYIDDGPKNLKKKTKKAKAKK